MWKSERRLQCPVAVALLIIASLALWSCDNNETSVPRIDGPNKSDGGKNTDGKVVTGDGTASDGTTPTDGPTSDRALADGPVLMDGPWPFDGPRPNDGPWPFDGPRPNDGPWPFDGPRPSDGPWPFDGPSPYDGPRPYDGPYVFDGPYPNDGPYPFDGPAPLDGPSVGDSFYDAPYAGDGSLDATTPGDGNPEAATPDMFVGDGTPSYDAVVGLSDSGQMLCMTPLGLEVCHCNDGLDNDGDGKTDYPDDTGCLGIWDNNEINGVTQCTDSLDNDGDQLIDHLDPECTGPLDNDESSYGTGIPGDNVDCKQDCFFDGDSGGGTDGCLWNLRCDPLDPGQYIEKNCPYSASMAADPKKCPPNQTQDCLDFCLPLTPNGCDCFGCCVLHHEGSTNTVLLRDTCHPEDLMDPTKCAPCTQVQDCLNTCEPCEVCLGKPSPEPWCFPTTVDAGVPPNDAGVIWPYDASWPYDGAPPTGDAGVPQFCDPGIVYCGPGGTSCPSGFYCLTGCCKSYDAP